MSKLLGVLCTMGSGYLCYHIRQKSALWPIQVAQAFLEDLALLRCKICVEQHQLPRIIEDCFCGRLTQPLFWQPLLVRIRGEQGTLAQCWSAAARALPEDIRSAVEALGQFLSMGGDALERAADETREELTRYLRREQEKQMTATRLNAAVCFAAACLVTLVLL